jgi:serine/threonine protein kinase
MDASRLDAQGAELGASKGLFAELLAEQGYKLESEIGCGGQAIVYSCFCERDGERYAVKIGPVESQKTIPPELEALQAVWNPHVINAYLTFVAEGYRFIVLELCPGGCLLDLINEGPIPLPRLWVLGQQIVDALMACHNVGVAHLDIKPQNILIDKFGRAKLCDFGLAKKTRLGEFTNQYKGSLAFIAPEIMKRTDYDPFRADVWSLGVTFYVCATGHLPWPTEKKAFFAGVRKGLEHVKDTSVPPEFEPVLKMMIVPDPTQRARLAEVMAIFQNHCGREPKDLRLGVMRPSQGPPTKRAGAAVSDFLRLKYLLGESAEMSGSARDSVGVNMASMQSHSTRSLLDPILVQNSRDRAARRGSYSASSIRRSF